MNFVLRMAWRDSRASRRRLALFSLSVVLGIAALVAIGSFGANLRVAIDNQARGLLGADLVITSRQPIPPAVWEHLATLGGEQSKEVAFSSMMVFPGADGINRTRLVQVRAVEGRFPFYGEFLTQPADAAARLARGEAVVILEETLLNQYGVKAGDFMKLRVGGPCGITFDRLLVRVHADFKLEVHIDTDEGNACELGPDTPVELIPR